MADTLNHQPHTPAASLRTWQIITFILLSVGYAGYYLCRSHLSVVAPLLKAELARRHMTSGDPKVAIGDMIAWGTGFYVAGKFLGGMAGDVIGGRRNFLAGMGGAVVFTLLFALSGSIPLLTVCWIGNRFIQAFGWPGLVKVAGKWTPYTHYGLALGILSLSYLFGDSAARLFMGILISAGFGWRSVFFVNAGVLAFWFVLSCLFLRESPGQIGLPELPVDPATTSPGTTDDSDAGVDTHRLGALLVRLLSNPGFWLVCLLSLATTFVRETFNNWTPTYFVEALHMDPGPAARNSAWFSLTGGISVLVFGWLSDKLGRPGRAICMVGGFGLSSGALFMLAAATHGWAGVWLGIAVAFVLIGPYSFLSGSLALDCGGRGGSATAAGIIDGVGYIAGILAGSYVARIASVHGWGAVFNTLGVVILAAAGISLAYLFLQTRPVSQPVIPSDFPVSQDPAAEKTID